MRARVPLCELLPEHRTESVLDRFVDKVSIAASGCWPWLGARTNDGYGFFAISGAVRARKQINAHRFAYLWLVGPIARGLTIDHLCRNRHCVNPAHMEPVSVRENTLRGEARSAENARKTHCKRGHPFDEVNTYLYRGMRNCKTCRREEVRRGRLRRREATTT